MRDNRLTEERDKELYNAYWNAFRQKDVRSHQQAISRAIRTPASRYYISPLQACRSIIRLKNGLDYIGVNPAKRRKIFAIYEVYQELAKRREFRGCSTFFIASFAVQHAAPEFYLSYNRALAIISQKRREDRHAR